MTLNAHTGPTPGTEGTRDAPGLLAALTRFAGSTRAGATAIAAVAVTVMTVGASALITDHLWLVDQRDVLKAAADAGAIAATLELNRRLRDDPTVSDAELKAALESVAKRYVVLNLQHLPEDRLAEAVATLKVEVVPRRAERTVDVSAKADLGGTLVSRRMPLFASSDPLPLTRVVAQVESAPTPVEVVLAIDVSVSMATRLNGNPTCTESELARGCTGGGPADARMGIVKRAAKALVGILEPSTDKRVAIGVVPWHTQVRLAPATAAEWARARWARYPTRRIYGQPYACRGANCTPPAPVEQALASAAPEAWKGCLDGHRMGSVGTRASLPSTSAFFTLPSANAFAQAFFPATQGATYACMTPPHPAGFAWNFCYHADTDDIATKEPQRGCPDGAPVILPLATDPDPIVDAIDALTPIGNRTYSALGLLWGQRLLDHAWKDVWGDSVHPVDPSARESDGVRKAIVLLTDGEDTHCGIGNESCADSTLGFSRADACAEAKKAGTEIFVVAAMHPDKVSDGLGDSLRACSSDSATSDVVYAFLNNSTDAELEAAFTVIADQLRAVRRVY